MNRVNIQLNHDQVEILGVMFNYAAENKYLIETFADRTEFSDEKTEQVIADLDILLHATYFKNPIDSAHDYVNELETALKDIIQIQPLDVFGPMSDRMRRIAREALK